MTITLANLNRFL